MSKMKDMITAYEESGDTIPVYRPGKGYVLGKVTKFSDDILQITPSQGNAYVIHFTQFSVEV